MTTTTRYAIEYLEIVVQNDIPILPSHAKLMLRTAIEKKLMVDPIRFGKPLRYSLRGHRRLRIGDYRIVYQIHAAEKLVLIVAI